MDVLLSLASPIGLIPLFILAGGIFLYIIVALGGWGERTLTQNSKAFLGLLGTVLTFIGLFGIFLVVYPAVRPNIVMIQDDFNLPNTFSTPMPPPATTPVSPTEQIAMDILMIGGSVAVVLMFLGLGLTIIRMGSSIPGCLPSFRMGIPRLPKYKAPKTLEHRKTHPEDENILDRLPKNK